MKIIIIIIYQFVFLQAGEIEPAEINFSYGLLGKAHTHSDSIVVLFHDSVIETNDKIRVNAGFVKNTYFYLIYAGSEEEWALLYSTENPGNKAEESLSDTLFVTALPWSDMTDPPGNETFYLLNSSAPLTELTKLLSRYESAPEKGKVKLGKKIQNHLDSLDPNSKEALSSIASRLDKPLVGGVAFRGDDDDELKDMSLTHKCKGQGGIAFQKIVLQHK